MARQIKTVYVIHHSHTDIGYTDLQERVMENQADYLRTVLSIMAQPENAGFRWNCETLFCVEAFFQEATEAEKDQFCALAAQGKLGLSANYLNFTDLLDSQVYRQRLAQWQAEFRKRGFTMETAMFADINGISMGCRDAMLDNGVKFLYTNIHCHHGMYPLRQNQTAYFWENANGQRLLVWNGEHYNLGNVLGIKPNRADNFMQRAYLGSTVPKGPVDTLWENLDGYLSSCEEQGYPYDFIITSVSGVFSDNAPPEPEILRMIQACNALHGQEVELQMVSLQELYAAVKDALQDAPVYRGDLTDWWANGVGSTPYAVKHYREAQQNYHLCRRLDPELDAHYPQLVRAAQDNLLLYAEHTWGHSATITNPYDTMVLNLDMRKNSYASKAHEAAARMLNRISVQKGDILRYYNTSGEILVCNPGAYQGKRPVEFYIENGQIAAMEILDSAGNPIPCQVSTHPRGRRISFVDSFQAHEEKRYTYRELPPAPSGMNTRQCYTGSEGVRDIVNDYDPETYTLPYGFENQFFRLQYRPHEGVTAFVDKRTGQDLLGKGEVPLFTPVYQCTPLRHTNAPCPQEYERRLLGRNIRGQHAETHIGRLEEVQVMDRGPVFTQLRLVYSLPGTVHADVILKFYAQVPQVDFQLELGKTISTDIESVFLPLSLQLPDSRLYLRKGTEAFRPGVDQIPGTCMEFYMSDQGLAYLSPCGGALIAFPDTPLVYMGSMAHHPIRLCQGREEDNDRPVYAWVMNNNWETNFKMDLSGFATFDYSLWLTQEENPEKAMDELEELTFRPCVYMLT